MNMHYHLMEEHVKRITVMAEVLRCLALFTGSPVSHGMVLAHVMGVLGVCEEDVGGYVYGAIFTLARAHPIEMNTPFEVNVETRLKVSDAVASWLLVGPVPDPGEDGEGGTL